MAEQLAIPRSGSCRTTDADYDPVVVRIGRRIEILVDHEPVRHVIAYDCNEGWVRALKLRGGPGLERPYVENGKAAEKTLHGRVDVRWR